MPQRHTKITLKKYLSYAIVLIFITVFQLIDRIFLNYFQYQINDQFVFGLVDLPNFLLIFLCLALLTAFITLKKYQFGIGLILSGSISNLIDRISTGGVIDYIKIPFFAPMLNLSDIFISFGALLIILAIIFKTNFQTKQKPAL